MSGPDTVPDTDLRDRLARISAEDFIRDTYDLDEVARMTADTMYKELFGQVQEQVKKIISGFNIPEEIRQVAQRRVDEYVPGILQRNVPKLVDAQVSWYKDTIDQLRADLEATRKELKEEGSKRRKIHRSLLAVVARVEALEKQLAPPEPEPLPPPKKGFWKWGRSKTAASI